MAETDGRLAPVTYLFGGPDADGHARRPSVSPPHDDDAPVVWNDSWGDDVASLASAPTSADAEKISLKALSRKSLSRREVEKALRAAELDDDVIEAECDRLTRVGLIDDSALAQTLVGTLQERKGLGRTAIAAELARRMIAPAAIEYALELVDSSDEIARARELARKRAGQLTGLDRDAAVRRLSGYLARRGYSGSAIRAAVDAALPVRPATHTVRFR